MAEDEKLAANANYIPQQWTSPDTSGERTVGPDPQQAVDEIVHQQISASKSRKETTMSKTVSPAASDDNIPQRDTGPENPMGKSRPPQSAPVHCLISEIIWPPEFIEKTEAQANELRAYLMPVGPIEEAYVNQLVYCRLRLLHIAAIETGYNNTWMANILRNERSFYEKGVKLLHQENAPEVLEIISQSNADIETFEKPFTAQVWISLCPDNRKRHKILNEIKLYRRGIGRKIRQILHKLQKQQAIRRETELLKDMPVSVAPVVVATASAPAVEKAGTAAPRPKSKYPPALQVKEDAADK